MIKCIKMLLLRNWMNYGKLAILLFIKLSKNTKKLEIIHFFIIVPTFSLYIQIFACKYYLITEFIFTIKQTHFNFLLTLRELKKNLKKIFFIIFASSKIKENKKDTLSKEEEIQIIIHHWIRTFNIQLGWIKDFDKIVVNYVSLFVSTVFIFDTFRSSAKLINTFTGHTSWVYSIDYSIFGDYQFICSGSADKTVRVWDVDNNKQIQSFNGHSSFVYCVKFSSYHYHNRQN
ncbi:WD-40 repeat-containing protein, partial [Reticulomyxa filosa]